MTTQEVFHFDASRPSFEDLGHDGNFRFWYARDFAALLGYRFYRAFQKRGIDRAIAACRALNVDIEENFVEEDREVDGKTVRDVRLSRFACYLTAMNGNAERPHVAAAQAYFARLTAAVQRYAQSFDDIERLAIRREVGIQEKSLARAASTAGVTQFGLFRDSQYRGLYNMPLWRLKQMRALPENRTPLDFMGRQELAANLFASTQTEARLRNEDAHGQQECEVVAQQVGSDVRATMIRISGTPPEHLPIERDIKTVRSALRATCRVLATGERGARRLQVQAGG